MAANTPPLPHTEGDVFTNEETGIKYQFSGGAWRAISSSASEEVAEAIDNIDLEKVLNNGNVADKDIYLTHIASSDADIIDISPEKAKIIIATQDNKVPTFELQHYAVDDNSQVKLELDEDGTRFDIECDEKVNNIHFRFEDDVKLELNKDGDAVFKGDVEIKGSLKSNGLANQGNANFKFSSGQKVIIDSGSSYEPMLHLKSYSSRDADDLIDTTDSERGGRKDVLIVRGTGNAELLGTLTLEPGETGNQAIVYNQYQDLQDSIVVLQQEVEKLSLVLDEGGDYRLLSTPENPADYVRNGIVYFGNTAGNPITDPSSWDEVGSIFIDVLDRNGNTHDFGPDVVQSGDLIELIGDNSFALFEVKSAGQYEEGLGKKFALWATTTIKATGVPGPNDTEYNIRSFRLGSLDVTETDARYVNLTGDEMTGALQIKPSTATTALDIFAGPNQSSGTSVFRVFGDNNQTNLYISSGGNLGARQGWSPSLSNHLSTKKYVDEKSSAIDDKVSKTGDKMTGRLETTSNIWIRPNGQGASGSNNMLVVNQLTSNGNGSIVRIQQDGVDIIKVQDDKTTSFNDYRIVNVGAPTSNNDATNKKYVEDYVKTEINKVEMSDGPAHFLYKYIGKDKAQSSLKVGEFTRTDSLLYVHVQDKNGWYLLPDPDKEDYWSGSYWLRAYPAYSNPQSPKKPSLAMHFKATRYYPWSTHEYIKFFDTGVLIGDSGLITGNNYYLDFGGFF